ncbi:MAG TPA: membrane dipeptidase [Myxococcota bacterium]|nr:membrane dipeptidase [Myxococcota bacterium]
MRRALVAFGVLLGFAMLAAFLYVPSAVDRRLNRVAGAPVPEPSSRARALFASLRVVDLHADSLLWDRDLSKRLPQGHVDLPRLLEGNVALQVFGVVTQAPLGQNFDRNDADAPDLVTALAVLERWSPRTWFSRRARVCHQTRALEKLAERSDGRLVVVRTAEDLRRFLAERATNPAMVAGLLGVEGAQAIEGRIENVDALFEAGVRMIGLAHFTDNAVAGSSAGADKPGLTDLGREVVRRMESLGIAVDLAHVSPAAIDDVLEIATEPVVVSHGGLQSVCPGPRNLSDEHVRAIAATGGLIGIGFFAGTTCGTSPADVARAIRAARDLAGAEHVALGSDFDGAVTTAFDVTGLASIVDSLQTEGMPDDEIRLVMGENALRVLGRLLP